MLFEFNGLGERCRISHAHPVIHTASVLARGKVLRYLITPRVTSHMDGVSSTLEMSRLRRLLRDVISDTESEVHMRIPPKKLSDFALQLSLEFNSEVQPWAFHHKPVFLCHPAVNGLMHPVGISRVRTRHRSMNNTGVGTS